jgi:3-oxoacyl-[acyl-carrier-protein] synthase-3
LFGDAATATWLSRELGAEIGRGDYGTDGSGAKHLMVRSGGSAGPFDHLDRQPCPPPEPQDVHLHMNGRAIFNFMMTRVPETIDRCLARNGRDIREIDYFVFHQASRFLLEQLVDRLQLPADKVPISMAHSGNTVSSTVPMVLADLLENHELEDRLVLISGFGVGLSWASNILSFGERNEP